MKSIADGIGFVLVMIGMAIGAVVMGAVFLFILAMTIPGAALVGVVLAGHWLAKLVHGARS